ncbi:MAG: LPS export ABC transporter permease LptG [Alphaproteobacteria bacterium]|jgi:lipopolysaccharide export system permease protein|nr:LPS export ABC transporter permease LptG [Alphaproteobacteria bacterium]MBP9877195.1 LPS export ABC transporter permease LptG [Alphaproteobacteria bacterium]
MKYYFSPVLFKYLSRQFLTWFLVVFAILLFLIWTVEIVELLRKTGSKVGVSFGLVLEMAFLKLHESLQKVFPFIVLFASMISFLRLSRNQELTVMRSAGNSIWQMMLPIICCAFLIGVINVTMLNPVGALMLEKYNRINTKHVKKQTDVLDLSETGLWFKEMEGNDLTFLHAKTSARDLSELYSVTVYFVRDFKDNIDRIDAEKAVIQGQRWILHNVVRHDKIHGPKKMDELVLKTQIDKENIEDGFLKPSSISFWKLPHYIEVLGRTGLMNDQHILYYQTYLAQPLTFVAMVMFGMFFSVGHHRFGNFMKMIASGMCAGVLYYIVKDVLFAMGLSQSIPIFIAAWAPAVLGLFIAVPLIIHKEDG